MWPVAVTYLLWEERDGDSVSRKPAGTDFSLLFQAAEHDHCRHTLIHHHLPEVSDGVLHRTLGYDECLLLTITLGHAVCMVINNFVTCNMQSHMNKAGMNVVRILILQ